MPVDVLDRVVEVVDDPDRQLQIEELGIPVGGFGGGDVDSVRGGNGPLVADQLHAVVAQVGQHAGQELGGDRVVDQQGLGGVADAGTVDLGVDGDRTGHFEVGFGVDVDVVVARRGVHHRHRRDILERVLQALSTPRDEQVDHALLGGEFGQLLTAAAGREHDRVGRQAGLGQAVAHDFGQRRIGALGVARAPEQDGVAALDRQHGAVDGHVRPGLIDHGDDAERDPDLAELDAAVEGAAVR